VEIWDAFFLGNNSAEDMFTSIAPFDDAWQPHPQFMRGNIHVGGQHRQEDVDCLDGLRPSIGR